MHASRFAPLMALLLSCSALSGPAQAGWFDFGAKSDKSDAKADKAAADAKTKSGDAADAMPAATLDESIRQAQMLRVAGSYQEAIRHLSQLMMVAADDPRVVSEYGKTLSAMGRSQDAVSFLTRAQQLQPGDWTIYSALGVAYDQNGNQKEAQAAYERALALKPGEASVLSNYALSRLLAKDSAMASNLAGRAEIANAVGHDDKIARNIAMIHSVLGDKPADAALAVTKPAPTAQVAAAQAPVSANLPPVAAPRQPVQRQTVTNQVAANAPVNIPSPPPPQAPIFNTQQPRPATQAPAGVVMQRVPVDPLAGPVNGTVANRAPRPLQPRKTDSIARVEPVRAESAHAEPAKAQASHADVARATADAAKATPAATPLSPTTGRPMTPAEALQARAEAIAKNIANKPAAIAAVKNEAAKPAPGTPATPVKTADAKAAEAKPVPAAAPAAKPATPVKAAEAKPAAPATKTAAAKPRDAVPALRVSSSAY